MRLFDWKALMLRCFPGLAGFHVLRYGRVVRVAEDSGLHQAGSPKMTVDLRLLTADFKHDKGFEKEIRGVVVSGSSEFVQALPNVGVECLLAFPFWQADQATVLGILYNGKNVSPEADTYRMQGAEKVVIEAGSTLQLGSGEDVMVLAGALVEKLETLCDHLGALGNSVCGNGNPLNPAMQAQAEQLKAGLAEIKSNVQLGKGTHE